jgi:hypothetical protein
VQGDDGFLDGAARDQADDGDGAALADAVAAIGGLIFDGGVPPGIEVDDGVGGGEVEASAASFE